MSNQAWSQQRVLVTGGCGFVGAHLVRRLLDHGAYVRVVDDLSRGRLERLAGLGDRLSFDQGDLTDPDVALRACRDMDAVFNLAARTGGLCYGEQNHAEILSVNTRISLNVIDAARQAGVQRYIFFSSSCVYSEDAPIPYQEVHMGEGPPEHAHLGYGWGKRLGEAHGALYRREHGMDTTSIRVVNVSGPGDDFDLETGHVIPQLVMKALGGSGPLEVMGSGSQTRSFIHVTDLCEIVLKIAESGQDLEVLNVSAPWEVSISEVAHMVVAAAQCPGLEIRYDPSKPEGARRKVADLNRLMVFLGDYQFVKPEESIRQVVEEYRQLLSQNTPPA